MRPNAAHASPMDLSRSLLDRLVAWSPVLLLGSLAAMTYWLDAQIAAPGEPGDGARRHDPDIFVENVRAVSFDKNGVATQILSAARADHFPDDDTTQLTAPQITLNDPEQPTFHVTSDTAKVSGDRANAWFSGNVKATRDAETVAKDPTQKPAGAVTLTTEFLHVLPNDHKVETDKPVTIAETRGIMHGTGLRMDLNTKHFTLLPPVSGTFEPQALPQAK
jgi:lipopolysaccharide export system protein LptC